MILRRCLRVVGICALLFSSLGCGGRMFSGGPLYTEPGKDTKLSLMLWFKVIGLVPCLMADDAMKRQQETSGSDTTTTTDNALLPTDTIYLTGLDIKIHKGKSLISYLVDTIAVANPPDQPEGVESPSCRIGIPQFRKGDWSDDMTLDSSSVVCGYEVSKARTGDLDMIPRDWRSLGRYLGYYHMKGDSLVRDSLLKIADESSTEGSAETGSDFH